MSSSTKLFVGIDPGVEGGIAFYGENLRNMNIESRTRPIDLLCSMKMPSTPLERIGSIKNLIDKCNLEPTQVFVALEQQTPRPTTWMQKDNGGTGVGFGLDVGDRGLVRSSVLRSTCILYGNYTQWLGILAALQLPYDDCLPKRWQHALGIPARTKEDNETKWKNKLKQRAMALFPNQKITLWNADAFLLLEYARRVKQGQII